MKTRKNQVNCISKETCWKVKPRQSRTPASRYCPNEKKRKPRFGKRTCSIPAGNGHLKSSRPSLVPALPNFVPVTATNRCIFQKIETNLLEGKAAPEQDARLAVFFFFVTLEPRAERYNNL